MAIQVDHKVLVQAYRSSTKKNAFYKPDDTASLVSLTGFDRCAAYNFSISASATESLDFGDITTVRGVFLQVSGDCTLKINGSSDAISLKTGSSLNPAKFFIEATITQIDITAGSSAITGEFCAWGDPTA